MLFTILIVMLNKVFSSKSPLSDNQIARSIFFTSCLACSPLTLYQGFSIILLIANLSGIGPLFESPFSSPYVAISSALLLMFTILFKAMVDLRSKFILYFMPDVNKPLTAIVIALEFIATISRICSLGIRLAINLSVGGLIVHIITGVAGPSLALHTGVGGFLFFEEMIGFLQAYIFMFIVRLTYSEVFPEK